MKLKFSMQYYFDPTETNMKTKIGPPSPPPYLKINIYKIYMKAQPTCVCVEIIIIIILEQNKGMEWTESCKIRLKSVETFRRLPDVFTAREEF